MNFTQKLRALIQELNSRHGEASPRNPRTIKKTLSDIPVNSAAPQQFSWGGMTLGLSSASHASAVIQVCFDEQPPTNADDLWYNLTPSGRVRRPDGLPFSRFFARLAPNVAQSTTRACIFLLDPDPSGGVGQATIEAPRVGNVAVSGKLQVEVGFQTASAADVTAIASNEGALAIAGWDTTNYTRMLVDTSGRVLIAGAAANGAAVAGNPVLMGGSDGANARTLKTDANGNLVTTPANLLGTVVQGPTNDGATQNGFSVPIGGKDNSGNARTCFVVAQGSATGATPNVLIVGGNDGTNARTFLMDTSGRANVVGAAASGSATAGNPVLMGGTDWTNARTLTVTGTGAAVSGSQTILNVGGQDSAGNAAGQKFGNTGTVHVVNDVFRQRVVNVPEFIGAHANGWNNAATGANGTSASIDIAGFATVSVFGNTSGATTFTVQQSQDNTNFYDSGTTNAPAGAANFGFTFSCGSRYVRIKSLNNVTVTLTVAAKN